MALFRLQIIYRCNEIWSVISSNVKSVWKQTWCDWEKPRKFSDIIAVIGPESYGSVQ
jgi:hypothetical protein